MKMLKIRRSSDKRTQYVGVILFLEVCVFVCPCLMNTVKHVKYLANDLSGTSDYTTRRLCYKTI